MKGIEKGEKGTPGKTIHVNICDTDVEISEARKKELALWGRGLSKYEVATKISPEPFGP